MSNYLLRLLKIALISTLGFGGGIGLLVFIIVMTSKGNSAHAGEYALIAGGVIGIIFTVLFFCVFMPLDLLFRLSIAKSSKNKDNAGLLDHEQSRKLVLNGTSKHVHFICRQALLAIPGIKDVQDDMSKDQMTASTSASWRSAGEQIEVKIYRGDSNQFHLNCVSRPAMKNVIFDYGKNFENVEIWKSKTEEFVRTGLGFN